MDLRCSTLQRNDVKDLWFWLCGRHCVSVPKTTEENSILLWRLRSTIQRAKSICRHVSRSVWVCARCGANYLKDRRKWIIHDGALREQCVRTRNSSTNTSTLRLNNLGISRDVCERTAARTKHNKMANDMPFRQTHTYRHWMFHLINSVSATCHRSWSFSKCSKWFEWCCGCGTIKLSRKPGRCVNICSFNIRTTTTRLCVCVCGFAKERIFIAPLKSLLYQTMCRYASHPISV